MVKSNLFINYLFLIFFLLNNCFSQEKIVKSISISGSPSKSNQIVFFNNEIMNVNFDELSAKPYNFYYSVEHYDYNWELSNIFKSLKFLFFITTSLYWEFMSYIQFVQLKKIFRL